MMDVRIYLFSIKAQFLALPREVISGSLPSKLLFFFPLELPFSPKQSKDF
jgi:hypothetical protein